MNNKESKEKRRVYMRNWDKANRERTRERRRETYRLWREANPERCAEYQRKYRETHRRVLCERAQKYKEAHAEQVKEYRRERTIRNREYQKTIYRQLRAEVIARYGGECKCCGETNLAFLTMDHAKNNGAEDRRRRGIAGAGTHTYRWLRANGYPDDGEFQVLCYNCNCSKQHDMEGHRAAHPKAKEIDGGC